MWLFLVCQMGIKKYEIFLFLCLKIIKAIHDKNTIEFCYSKWRCQWSCFTWLLHQVTHHLQLSTPMQLNFSRPQKICDEIATSAPELSSCIFIFHTNANYEYKPGNSRLCCITFFNLEILLDCPNIFCL